ncbi:unnamed protein product [Blepharisma stoltei]|uniref:RING-type domain-containing protein n=1 Tax=Blepharisma stoltei TaxID=1481888 RepID=A0AAU9IQB5_9CILI|nr:unnamed protein product [Blepharisma stoltei]
MVTWQDFTSCVKPIEIWLLVSCALLALIRFTHILENFAENEPNEPWCFQAFSRSFSLSSIISVGVIYPIFLAWIIIGTFWFAEVQSQAKYVGSECFKNPQEKWYFALWLVVFYSWIIAYTTSIMISILSYLRNRVIEGEYTQLIEQYGNEDAPSFTSSARGLSPGSILKFNVSEINSPERGAFICSVCLEDLQVREKVRIMPCGHRFHLRCIDIWLMRQSNCPNCKRNLRLRSSESALVSL